MYRPTYIEVDCTKIENNVKNIVKNYPNYEYYFGVVKNNCYHHGAYSAKYLVLGGVNYLAVSSLEEAIQIRNYVPDTPILCLEPIKTDFVFDAINYNVTITIGSFDEAKELANYDFRDDLKIHLKVDSGMNRLGFKSATDFKNAYHILSGLKHVIIEGVYTHIATAGIQDPYYQAQVNAFKDIVSGVGFDKFKIVHADRSLTLVLHDKIDFVNGVRIGITLYGFDQNISINNFLSKLSFNYKQKKYNITNTHLSSDLSLSFPLSMYSEVIETRKVSKGEFVGYGANYIVSEDCYIATIPCGYADGVVLPFKYVYINNKPYEIIAECMDMIMVKADKSIKRFTKVEIVGKNQSIRQLASRLNTNAYKVLNSFSTRVPIVYRYNSETYEIKY